MPIQNKSIRQAQRQTAFSMDPHSDISKWLDAILGKGSSPFRSDIRFMLVAKRPGQGDRSIDLRVAHKSGRLVLEKVPKSKHTLAAQRLDAALTEGQERGKRLLAEILRGPDMLSAEAFGKMVGLSRQAVLNKRARHELLGLHGFKRGFRFPTWQVTPKGQPLPDLPRLFMVLGNDEWAVYRFLKERHPELDGRTALQELQVGHVNPVLDAAENAACGMS